MTTRSAADLLSEAMRQHGVAKLDALDLAARAADAQSDRSVALQARDAMVDVANKIGDPERMLQAFTWCLAQHDKGEANDPSLRESAALLGLDDDWRVRSLLWRYKWVVSVLPGFPQISRARIHAVLDDMDRRFRAFGNQVRAVHGHRAYIAARFGDVDKARAHLKDHKSVSRDGLADCHACEADAEVELLVSIGAPTEALHSARVILDGRLSCAEVPARTHAHAILPLLDGGDVDGAIAQHLKGMTGMAKLADKACEIAHNHITFLAVTNNLVRGLNLLKRVWPHAIAHTAQETRMRIHASAAVLLKRVAEQKATVKLAIPEGLALASKDGAVDAAKAHAFFVDDALAIAAKFDARNGNTFVSDGVKATLARPFIDRPLAKSASSADDD